MPRLNFTIIIITLSIIFKQGLSQNTSSKYGIEAEAFAKTKLSNILRKIPNSQLSKFGFNNTKEFLLASTSKALYFEIYDDTNNTYHTIWRVPIVVNGEYRALLNVVEENGYFSIADFGATILAQELQQTIENNTNLICIGLIRSYKKGSDFIIAKNGEGEKVYIPLNSARKSFKEKNIILKPIYSHKEFKALLR